MKTNALPGPVHKLTLPVEQAFKVLIAYDNRAASIEARQVQNILELLCGNDRALLCAVWNCNLFRKKQMREIAVKEANAANMIVISLHSDKGLPAHFVSWVEGWHIRSETNHPVLVVLSGAAQVTKDVLPAKMAYLRLKARICGLEFLCKLPCRDRFGFPKPNPSNVDGEVAISHDFLSSHHPRDKREVHINN